MEGDDGAPRIPIAIAICESGESCWLNLFDIQLVRYTGKVMYPTVRTTASTHRLNDSTPHDNPRFNSLGHPPFALIAAQPSAPAPPHVCRVQAKHPSHRIPHPLCPGGSTPGPGARANTSAPPRRPGTPSSAVHTTCSLRSSQWYHARRVSLIAWHPARESDVENQVPPPHVTPPSALIAAQPSAPAPPYTCRVQPKQHQCIASRTHLARPGPLPRPEHAHTHRPPCRPHVAGAWLQVLAGDSRGARRPSLARSLRA
eukprot:scaffold18418_cov55-Phaeocystis_antarctica.AAC.1